jgi:hypothetical protein
MTLNPFNWGVENWRLFFLISALWNFFGGVPGALKPADNLEKYYNVKTDDFITIFLNRGIWICVLIFGIGYLLVAYDPVMFYGIIIMGIIGKIAIAFLWFYLRAIGKLEMIGVIAATGDLLFTVLFIISLFSNSISPCRL